MTERKTRSLTLAIDPVARLRELHDLDAAFGSPAVPSVPLKAPNSSSAAVQQRENGGTQQHSNVETLPHNSGETQERDNADTQQQSSAEVQERNHAATVQRRNTPSPKRSSETVPAFQEASTAENPVREAMRQALRQPYSTDLEKGASTATTIRIPTEIWERLDMASTLQAMTKQDIIAEALKQHLTRIGRAGA